MKFNKIFFGILAVSALTFTACSDYEDTDIRSPRANDDNVRILASNPASLELDPAEMEKKNQQLQAKYRLIADNEVRYEMVNCDDADIVIVAFGSAARISHKAMETAREQGRRVGLFRPITLWPFPTDAISALCDRVKGLLTVEINAGQMVFDVRYAAAGRVPVNHYGRLGGIVPDPDEIIAELDKFDLA